MTISPRFLLKCLLLVAGIAAACPRASATNTCYDRYDYIGKIEGSHWFWSRAGQGSECVGNNLMRLDARGDSVSWRLEMDWINVPDQVLGERFETALSNDEIALLDHRIANFARYGITVVCPDSAAYGDTTFMARRPPTTLGRDAQAIFWEGCGKYWNYRIRDAILDIASGHIILITHSDRYIAQYQCGLGDGIVVLKLVNGPIPWRPRPSNRPPH